MRPRALDLRSRKEQHLHVYVDMQKIANVKNMMAISLLISRLSTRFILEGYHCFLIACVPRGSRKKVRCQCMVFRTTQKNITKRTDLLWSRPAPPRADLPLGCAQICPDVAVKPLGFVVGSYVEKFRCKYFTTCVDWSNALITIPRRQSRAG